MIKLPYDMALVNATSVISVKETAKIEQIVHIFDPGCAIFGHI